MSLDNIKRFNVRKLLMELEDSILGLGAHLSKDEANILIVKSKVESELFHEGISKGKYELEVRFLANNLEYKLEVEVEHLPRSL